MVKSALRTACDSVGILSEMDEEGLPRLAQTYNRLGKSSKADILCFVHDDIEFLSDGWDNAVQELFVEYPVDLLGVVGTTEYAGGRLFDAGTQYGLGHYCCEKDGVSKVKFLSKSFRYKPAKVIDGMIMFVRKSFFDRESFDESFDELFFYDMDLCLRGRVGITTNVFVKHSKPQDLYGKYPANLKGIEAYTAAFNAKHGFSERPIGNQVCGSAPLELFLQKGQNELYAGFSERYLTHAP